MKKITVIEQSDNFQFSFYDNYLGTILRSFEGFEYPEVRESIDYVAGEYGSVYITSKYGNRRVSWGGDLVSSSVYTLRRNLHRALRQTGMMKLIKFTTYDNLDLQFEAEIVKYLNPYTHQIHEYLIEAIAPDWRFYSQTETTFTMGRTSVVGGAGIPTAVPMSLSSPATDEAESAKILVAGGDEVTDPIFTIHGPGTNFTLRNDTLDKELLLSTTLIANDEVVIDVKNRTVIKNGTENLYPSLSGDFWSLIPGDNDLRFNVQTGGTDESLLDITYRDAYGGI